MEFRDYEYKVKNNKYTVRENECTPRNNKYTRRDRSPSKRPTKLNTNSASYCAPHHVMHNNVPRPAPDKHLEESDTREEASRCESAGPLDLSVKKSNPSSQLHTQAHDMPRIFFRVEQNRI